MAEFSSYVPGTPSWVDLAWDDQQAAGRFYGEFFGWETADLGPDSGGYQMFTKNGKLVAGLSPKQAAGQPSYWTSYVSVEDASASARAVKDAGGTMLFGPTEVMEAGSMGIFQATDGSVASIWQPKQHTGAQLANEVGAFCWNELVSKDLDAAKAFYGSVFSWSPEEMSGGPMPYTVFNVQGRPVAGMTVPPPGQPGEVPSYWLVYFGTNDVEEAIKKVAELGGRAFTGAIDSPYGRLAVLEDPEHAPFAVIEVSEGA